MASDDGRKKVGIVLIRLGLARTPVGIVESCSGGCFPARYPNDKAVYVRKVVGGLGEIMLSVRD